MLAESFTMVWADPVTLCVSELLNRYYHPETLKPLCTVCENFGSNYACPPMTQDMEALMRRYAYLHLFAARLTMPPMFGKDKLGSLFARGMAAFNNVLLTGEMADAGSLAVSPGHCTLCARCTRLSGLPCRHPEGLRLSLDAFSLEITRMTRELFHFQIQWYNDLPPDYLTMIGGLFSLHHLPPSPPGQAAWKGLTVTLPL